MSLCEDSKFYYSSLYSGSLPYIPGYQYNTTVSSNSLFINITQYNQNTQTTQNILNLVLEKPLANTSPWSDFFKIYGFNAYAPPPQTNNVYEFKFTALDNLWNAIPIKGKILNNSFALANLAFNTTWAPALCPEFKLVPDKDPCAINLINNALSQTQKQYEDQMQEVIAKFKEDFRTHCFTALSEKFTRAFSGADEYNYTLYYYDQVGNLQRTVPPKGADPGILTTVVQPLNGSTMLPPYSSATAVDLNYVTDYRYNGLNQLVQERSVDGGKTLYYYDEMDRLIASQNEKQRAAGGTNSFVCSYTLYDELSRIIEAGQVGLIGQTSWNYTSYSNFVTSVQSASNVRTEVTKVFYDSPTSLTSVLNQFNNATQSNLRNRVSYVATYASYTASVNDYDFASFYNYDITGNVTQCVQHTKQLDLFNQGLKKIDYEFEYFSGNMLSATYQKNKSDQLIHRYYYDADNRLKEVLTSKDNLNWDQDAKYYYYEHGPLARVERGDKKIQGEDYFYTIHGWIKGLNNDALKFVGDPGKDGGTGNAYLSQFADIHKWLPSDVINFSLNYYNTATYSDYKAIKTFNSYDANPLMSIAGFNNPTQAFYLDDNANNMGFGP